MEYRDTTESPVGVRDGWLSIGRTAGRLGVTSRTVYGLINRGELPGYRIGRVFRIRAEDVDAYVASRRIRPGSLDHLCTPAARDSRIEDDRPSRDPRGSTGQG
jgi:excisionase family DNA binding protein